MTKSSDRAGSAPLQSARRHQHTRRSTELRPSLENLETRVVPATVTWSGSGLSSQWSDLANWVNNDAPDAGDDLIFPASASRLSNVDDLASLSVNSISIDGNYSITGASGVGLTLAQSGTLPTGFALGGSTSTASLRVPSLVVASDATVALPGSGTATFTLLGAGDPLSGTGSLTVTGASTSTLRLGSGSTAGYSGSITVTGTQLALSQATTLGQLNLQNGASVSLEGQTLTVGTLNLDAGTQGPSITGTTGSALVLRSLAAGTSPRITLTGTGTAQIDVPRITLTSVTTIEVTTAGANLVIDDPSSALTGLGSLVKTGEGRLTLGVGSTDNYFGSVLVTSGSLTVSNNLKLGSVQVEAAARVDLINDSVLSVSNGVINGFIAGEGGLNKTSIGTLYLRATQLTGGLLISGGSVQLLASTVISTLSLQPNTYLTLPTSTEIAVGTLTGGSGTVNLNQGTLRIFGDSSTLPYTGMIYGPGNFIVDSLATMTLSSGFYYNYYYATSVPIAILGTLHLHPGDGNSINLGSSQVAVIADSTSTGRLVVDQGSYATIGSLVGSGDVVFPASDSAVQPTTILSLASQYQSSFFTGRLIGVGTLSNQGYYPLTLSSDEPATFLGDLCTNGYTIAVTGQAYAHTPVTVAGGRLISNQIGSIQTFSYYGSILPGPDGSGTLTVDGDVRLAGASLILDYSTADATNRLGLLRTPNGTVNLTDGAITIGRNYGEVPQIGDQFTIVEASAIVGQFQTPSVFNSGNLTYRIDYSSQKVTLTVVKIGTSTSFISPPYNLTTGQTVTFTVLVQPLAGGATPTGSVTFSDNFGLNTTVPLIDGVATITTNAIRSSGYGYSQYLRASYSGDETNSSSQSDIYINVATIATSTQVTSSLNPAIQGQEVQLIATVTGSGTSKPTGTVIFTWSPGYYYQNFYAPLIDGVATLATSSLPVGITSISVQYYGDQSYSGSHSFFPLVQQVLAAPATVQVVSSENPSPFGNAVTFTATVSPSGSSTQTPTGTVTFWRSQEALGTATVVNGVATLTTTIPSSGNSFITATYSGDSYYPVRTTSTDLIQVTTQSPVGTDLQSAPHVSVAGQPVTLTAIVSPFTLGTRPPRGSVTFRIGTTVLGTAALANGVANLVTTDLPVGDLQITADYNGDTDYLPGGFFGAIGHSVVPAPVRVNVGINANTSALGQAVSFTANVDVLAPGLGEPTGKVQFLDGTTVLGEATLVQGVARFTTNALPLGDRPISAIYQGDGRYASATSPSVNQTVLEPTSPLIETTTTLTSSTGSAVAGQVLTFVATAAAASAGSGTPTGFVLFFDGTSILGVSPLVNGKAMISVPLFGVDFVHTITARYLGDKIARVSESSAIPVLLARAETLPGLKLTPVRNRAGRTIGFTLDGSVGVAAPGGGTPTGTVTFFANGRAIRSVSLANGQASQFVRLSGALGRRFRIRFDGDSNYAASRSDTVLARPALLRTPTPAAPRPASLTRR